MTQEPTGPAAGSPSDWPNAGAAVPAHAQLYADPRGVRDTTGLAVASVAASALVALLTVANGLTAAPAVRAIATSGSGSTVETVFTVTAVATLLAGVAAWILTCLWLMAARRNTELLAPHRSHTRSPVWVWLGWIVPIVSLWFPFQVVRDVRQNSRPGAPVRLVGWWWAAYLAMVLLDRAQAGLMDDLHATGTVEVIGVLLSVAAVVALTLWALIVRDVVRAQADPTIER